MIRIIQLKSAAHQIGVTTVLKAITNVDSCNKKDSVVIYWFILRKAYGIWYIAIVLKLSILILVHNMIGCGADPQWTTIKMIHNYNCLASYHPQENLYIW